MSEVNCNITKLVGLKFSMFVQAGTTPGIRFWEVNFAWAIFEKNVTFDKSELSGLL